MFDERKFMNFILGAMLICNSINAVTSSAKLKGVESGWVDKINQINILVLSLVSLPFFLLFLHKNNNSTIHKESSPSPSITPSLVNIQTTTYEVNVKVTDEKQTCRSHLSPS